MDSYVACNLQDMPAIAQSILKRLRFDKPLLLDGPVGVGKTTLVKFLAQALGVKEVVNSPSYVIMKLYSKLVHVDAYRISGTLEPYEEFFAGRYVVVEWANNLNLQFVSYLKINVSTDGTKHVFCVCEEK